MPIVAMTYEAGSQGKEIGQQVAERLGLEPVCHEKFEQQVADRLQADGALVRHYLQGRSGLLERWKADQDALAAFTAEQVYDLAARGNVMLRGWGATHLLRPVAHALCVRVCAPIAHRLKVLKEELGISEEEARENIAQNDAAHAATMRTFGRGVRESVSQYDLVLNSARVPVADCVDEISRLSRNPAFQETAESRARLTALHREAQVRAALRGDAATSVMGPFVGVIPDPHNGHVSLMGAVQTYELKVDVERVVSALPWVSHVENRLHVVGPCRLE
jgi:cytidylate kinase